MENKRNDSQPSNSAGLLVPAQDYARIYSVVRSVLEAAGIPTHKACIFFSVAGAGLLKAHHDLPAYPQVGAALYSTGGDPTPRMISYGHQTEAGLVSDARGFHCWVECQGWAIDFMAPMFQESVIRGGSNLIVPSMMFQRHLTTMAPSHRDKDLTKPGSFFLEPNSALVSPAFDSALSTASMTKLVEICKQWYRPAPTRMSPALTLKSDNGTGRRAMLKETSLAGAW